MRVDVAEIRKNPGMKVHLELSSRLPPLEVEGQAVKFTGPARANLDVSNNGKALVVEGEVEATLEVSCARCLEAFNFPVKVDFNEIYYPAGAEGISPEEREEWIPFVGEVLDLTPEVVKSIVLALPMRFICREECRGLCPRCGKDLNRGECRCSGEDVDPRLAVLGELLKEMKQR